MSRRLSTCWVVTDGKTGMESQCVGLAEALGLAPEIRRVRMRLPWRVLSPYLRAGISAAFEDRDALSPPWPDILIASGRLSVAAAVYVRAGSRRSGRPTFTVQIQDPVISPANFDLVVAPLHDRLAGDNVVTTIGAMHGITPEKLAAAAAEFAPRVAALRPPYAGVLVGGPNASYRFGPHEISQLGEKLSAASRRLGASLLVTPSRRTGSENISLLKSALEDSPAFVWDGSGKNPYQAILGLSDVLVATADSVNMITEACAAGKSVYVFPLPGGSKKSARFLSALTAGSHMRLFEGSLEPYPVAPLREMDTVAAEIRRRFEN